MLCMVSEQRKEYVDFSRADGCGCAEALSRCLVCCMFFHQLDDNAVMNISELVQICSRTVVSVTVY